MFTNFCFSEHLLVAAANRFKVLKIFISLKVTVYIQDLRLRSEKALDVKGFEWKYNCTEMAKYTYDFKHKIERERERERETEREKRIQNPSQHLSKEVISSLEVTFTKMPILDVWKGSEYVVA